MLQQAYDDSHMSMPIFYHRYDVFRDGRENVVDKLREGQPSTARNKVLQNTVTITVWEDGRITVCELAHYLNILVRDAFATLHDDLQMWRCFVRVSTTFAYTRTYGTSPCCMQ